MEQKKKVVVAFSGGLGTWPRKKDMKCMQRVPTQVASAKNN